MTDFLTAELLEELRRDNREIGSLAHILFESVRYSKILFPKTLSNTLLTLLREWCAGRPGAADCLVKTIFELERAGALSFGEADFLICQICFVENTKGMG